MEEEEQTNQKKKEINKPKSNLAKKKMTLLYLLKENIDIISFWNTSWLKIEEKLHMAAQVLYKFTPTVAACEPHVKSKDYIQRKNWIWRGSP